ncbi:MAG: ClpXP protease specificity-enhancing factor [Pseudomonadota bacterium]|nr:ClpXP protease specificity-enhancing factor [Pseudomonadota bacterium]
MSSPSTKPYLLRAIYEWCVDSGYTPYLSVQVDGATRVPLEFVKEGLIVLNIGPNATRNLTMSNQQVDFHTRFNGVSREVSVPVGAITGIFARENGEGLAFEVERPAEGDAQDARRILDAAEEARPAAPAAAGPAAQADADEGGGPSDPPPGSPPRGRPSLRVIK